MRLIGEGAEAKLFLEKNKVTKKRFKKKYRDSKLDEKLRRERTKREARILAKANEKKLSTPEFFSVNEKENEIVFSFEKGVLASKKELSKKTIQNIASELAGLHEAGITHGDFTTSNILISKKPVIIDFGLSEFSSSTEEQATDLLLFEKSVSPEQFSWFKESYAKQFTNHEKVFNRLEAIKKRARYSQRN
ncbi:MAG: KEOPS complex kinase/ATPase Bud32 [Candidatus Micrarchaeota archaeon]